MNTDRLKDFISKNKIAAQDLFEDIENYLEQEYDKRGKTFRRSSPYGMILRVLVGLVNLVFFYIEDALVEYNIRATRRPETVRGMT